MGAAVKLQRAFDRERSKSDASRKRGEEVMSQARTDWEKKQAAEKNKEQGVTEGLSDWIFTKIDNFLDMPKVSSNEVSKLMKQAPANLSDDIAEKLVDRFM
jgi:hypothetical protein